MPNKNFNHKNYSWKKNTDYRKNPELYRVGKGEQGVLICNPYKNEILPYWRFKTPEVARISSEKIYAIFLNYLEINDFVGADMARKYLQMGFTRARRYANYPGGRKYLPHSRKTKPKLTEDPVKAKSAKLFYKKWRAAENNSKYKKLKNEWKKRLG